MDPCERDIKVRLLLAAKKLFSRQSFDGTTIRQICEEAGANVALISYHFGGKDNIFRALFDMSIPQRITLDKLLIEQMEPVEGIRYMIREVIAFQTNNPELVRIVQQETSHFSPRLAIIREYLQPVWLKVRELLEEGKRQGVFHFRSLDSTFLYIWGGLLFHREFEFFASVLSEPPETPEQRIEDVTHFVLGALGCTD